MSLFDKVKTKTEKKKSTKSDKHLVEIKEAEFATALKNLAETDKELKEIEAKNALAKGIVKERAMEEFAKIYSREKRNIGSFNISSEDHIVLFQPTKKYIKIDEDLSQELEEKYGEGIIERETKFSFNTALLEKYMSEISDAIMSIEGISDEEKEDLLIAETTINIEKEALDRVPLLAEKAKVDIEEVLEDLNYVAMLKQPKPIK